MRNNPIINLNIRVMCKWHYGNLLYGKLLPFPERAAHDSLPHRVEGELTVCPLQPQSVTLCKDRQALSYTELFDIAVKGMRNQNELAQEMAEKLDVKERIIYRDMEDLKNIIGYVGSVKDGYWDFLITKKYIKHLENITCAYF